MLWYSQNYVLTHPDPARQPPRRTRKFQFSFWACWFWTSLKYTWDWASKYQADRFETNIKGYVQSKWNGLTVFVNVYSIHVHFYHTDFKAVVVWESYFRLWNKLTATKLVIKWEFGNPYVSRVQLRIHSDPNIWKTNW